MPGIRPRRPSRPTGRLVPGNGKAVSNQVAKMPPPPQRRLLVPPELAPGAREPPEDLVAGTETAARHALPSTPGDDPDRVHDPRDVAEEREQNVEPELAAEANLEVHSKRRQQDRQQDADQVHRHRALRRKTGVSRSWPAPRLNASTAPEVPKRGRW